MRVEFYVYCHYGYFLYDGQSFFKYSDAKEYLEQIIKRSDFMAEDYIIIPKIVEV